MQKKLLTTAVGAALAGLPMLATHADVKVGGHAQVEYYQAEAEATPAAGGVSFSGSGLHTTSGGTVTKVKGTGLIDNARGRFWITASEDLGGGMKGLAHFEVSVDTANSGQAIPTSGNSAEPYDSKARGFDARAREKYVGLAGGFGAVKLGNQHGVYKRLGGVRWDPFNATVLEARGNGGQSGSADVNAAFAHNGFIPGAIKWESGKLLGDMVYVEALYAPHKNDSGAGDAGSGNDYQAGVSIKPIKDLEIIAAYSNNKKQPNIAANSDQKATKVGARYTFLKDHTVWLQWEDVDINNSADGGSVVNAAGITTAVKGQAEYTWVGYQFKFGNNAVVAQYGQHDRDITGVDVETTYANVGLIHSFSKTTRAWAGYRNTEAKQGAIKHERTVFALGLRKDF